MRYRMIQYIRDHPANANQISEGLNVNYRTIEHHLRVLAGNNLITYMGDGYGKVYFLSDFMTENIDISDEILSQIYKRTGDE